MHSYIASDQLFPVATIQGFPGFHVYVCSYMATACSYVVSLQYFISH